MPSACKFYPSCSHYAVEAVRLHGARQGSWLALRRVLRCHPFSRGGVDLVPDPDEKRTGHSRTGFSLSGLNCSSCSQPKNRGTERADADAAGICPTGISTEVRS